MSHPVNDMIADQVIDQVASLQDHQVNSELMRLGVPGQFVELVSITSTAFGINPGTPPQSTVIEFVPCPVWRVPPFIDHWYVEPTVFVTKYCSPTEFTHTVSGLIVV